MPRKIVIIPSFASSHFLKCWIPNVIDVIDPDIIIINEGLFPNGPENKGHVDNDKFRSKYCHETYKYAGFDFEDTLKNLHSNADKCKIGISYINYHDNPADACFLQCMTSFGLDGNTLNEFVPEVGDLIFPIEPDAFLFEGDKEVINAEISKLKPGEGIQCKWMDFLETQYYTEAINLQNPKFRRFCYCFDTLEKYKKAIDGFMSQNYPLLRKTESFFIRHYPWFVTGKWKELRYELIYRSDPQYWKDFEEGLQEIRKISTGEHEGFDTMPYIPHDFRWPDIVIRPSRQDEGRFAKFIDIEHPKHIQSHPNFVK